MDLIKVALASLGSIVALFLLTKLMGKRQIAQLSFFDYIVGITVGSIAAEMATELEKPLRPLVAMVVYALVAVGISFLTDKSLFWRKIITGRSIVLMEGGRLYRENMRKSHIDLHELLSAARDQGYFDLRQIDTAVLEYNGKLSFLPRESDRPYTVGDANLKLKQSKAPLNLITDGVLLKENLKMSGKDDTWLQKNLDGLPVSEIFYAAVADDTLFYYPKHEKPCKNDHW